MFSEFSLVGYHQTTRYQMRRPYGVSALGTKTRTNQQTVYNRTTIGRGVELLKPGRIPAGWIKQKKKSLLAAKVRAFLSRGLHR